MAVRTTRGQMSESGDIAAARFESQWSLFERIIPSKERYAYVRHLSRELVQAATDNTPFTTIKNRLAQLNMELQAENERTSTKPKREFSPALQNIANAAQLLVQSRQSPLV